MTGVIVPGAPLGRSRLRPVDLVRVATIGPRTRRLRTVLTTLGIAIGIAALVAVMGISASTRADLLAELQALGTNRLQVRPGTSFSGADEVTLPATAGDQIRRLTGVERAAATSAVDATVRRSEVIPEADTSGITAQAAELDLVAAVGATVADGRWHDAASATLPTVVLGAEAAARLGIDAVTGASVVVGDERFTVIGILDPVPLYAGLDTGAFVGAPAAASVLDADLAPSAVYVVADPDALATVRELLPATTHPTAPAEVEVSNPSDALAAQEAVDETLTGLLLGLGGVALLVGGIGIANVMVIGVLERRSEIGVRRALGATRGHVRIQFLLEAALLGVLGGAVGVGLGVAVTATSAAVQHQVLAVPPAAVGGGLGAAVLIGAVAGLAPASRAARLPPADAIRPA